LILEEYKEPKRICFATTHATEPKRSKRDGYAGSFNVPFGDGFARLFPYDLFPNRHDSYHEDSVWRSISSKEEFEEIDAWVKQQENRVFLRDCLSASIAMSYNFTDRHEGERTEIGALEYRAKQHQDMDAVEALAGHCRDTIMEIPLYREADLLCAPPPRPSKEFDLPSQVVSIVSNWIGKSECRRARDAKRDIPVPLSPCARATTCTCRGRPAPGPRLRHFAPPPDPYDEWLDGVSDALASGLRQLRDLRPLRHFGQPLAPTPTADYPPRASRFPGGQRTTLPAISDSMRKRSRSNPLPSMKNGPLGIRPG